MKPVLPAARIDPAGATAPPPPAGTRDRARRLLARIADAVRAAHAARVPF